MNELALFAGGGGGILGGCLLGWRTVCAVEIERYPREILLARQRDGVLPPFPVWDDVRTFDGRPWRGLVDVVSGGFPCQDISSAGRGAGIDGERSGLWAEMRRIISEVRPRFAFLENSPLLVSRGLGRVLGDLAEIGYSAAWVCLSAEDCGAPHKRERIWILAVDDATGIGCSTHEVERGGSAEALLQARETGRPGDAGSPAREEGLIPHAESERLQEERRPGGASSGVCGPAGICCPAEWETSWWVSEPAVGRVADGVAARVDRLKALGNGQVPVVAARAFCTLLREFEQLKNVS